MVFNRKSTVTVPSFNERMTGIKSMLQTVYESSNNLHAEIEKEIESKNAQICILQSDIESIKAIKLEIEAFLNSYNIIKETQE